MPLSQADIQQIESHFQTTGVRLVCPACNATGTLEINAERVAVPLIRPGMLGIPGATLIQLICSHCGYVLHFSAKVAGVAP